MIKFGRQKSLYVSNEREKSEEGDEVSSTQKEDEMSLLVSVNFSLTKL